MQACSKSLFLSFLFAITLCNSNTAQVTDRWIPLDELKDFINFIIDPVDTNILYATHSYGICKSNNGGTSWTDIQLFVSDYTGSIVQNPVNRDTLYIGVEAIGTGGRGVYRSANRGNTWTQLYSTKSVSCLEINPLKPWIIYAGTDTNNYTQGAVGVLKSVNAGNTWIQKNSGLGNKEIKCFLINPQDTGTLFVGTANGLYKSYNGGENWFASGTGLPGGSVINFIAIHPADTNIMYAGLQGDGLYKSVNAGTNWVSSGTGITNFIINWITINPVHPEIIYTSVDEGGVFRSINGGTSWTQMDRTGAPSAYKTWTIRLNPLNPDIVYALFGYGTTAARIYKRLEDFTPPDVPVNLKGIPGDKEVTLSWKMNEESDLDHYKIYRDSVFIANVPVTGPEDSIYTASGLNNMQTYRFMVSAVDKKGNESNYSQEINIMPYFNPQGLVAWFRFDGNANDATGHGNNGSSFDCEPAENRYGDADASYYFNGNSSYINCGNHPMLDMTIQVTLMAWINPQSADDTAYIISKAQLCDHSGNYNLRILPGRQIEFTFKEGSGEDLAFQSSGTIPLNKWTHIAVSYNYTNHSLGMYFNALSVAGNWTVSGSPQEQTSAITTNDLSIGASIAFTGSCYGKDAGEPVKSFNGFIDEVYIYNLLLDETTIREIAQPGPKSPANLKILHCNGKVTLTDETYIPKNVRLFRIYRNEQSPAITIHDSVFISDISDIIFQEYTGYDKTLYYRIKAIDSSGIESNFSNEVMISTEKPVDLGSDQDLCQGEFVFLDAGGGFFSYEWSVSVVSGRYLSVNKSGIYWVKVTDMSQTCITYDSISILVHDNSYVNLGPDRMICPGRILILRAGKGYNNYLWSTGSTADTLVVSEPGTYSVTVAAGETCEGYDSVTITPMEPYQDQKICLVTVDPVSDRLVIVWEKEPGKGTAWYNIYREGDVIGKYELIRTVPYDQLSVIVDTASEPGKKQYLYKISVVDSCENESEKSPYHKTLFLQYAGSTGGVNLEWSEYKVEDGSISFGSYYIYRGSSSSGLMHIETLSASLDRYIDKDPDAIKKQYFYRIAGVLVESCYPTGNMKNDTEPISLSYSNLENNNVSSTGLEYDGRTKITAYPNPAIRKTTILFPNPHGNIYKFVITDISGRIVRIQDNITSDKVELERNDLPAGVYLLEIIGNEIYRTRIIFE